MMIQDSNGDKMTKGGQKLVTYPQTNHANNRQRQLYNKSNPGSDGTNMGTPVAARDAISGIEGGGGGVEYACIILESPGGWGEEFAKGRREEG